MNFTQSKKYLLKQPESCEDFPFGPDAHVFKVRNKVFAILSKNDDFARMNLKCDPDEALALYGLVVKGLKKSEREALEIKVGSEKLYR